MTAHLTPDDYLKKILTARVYDVALESALEPAHNLSRRLHNRVLFKREDQQPVFSFKLRGAYNKMAQLAPEQLQRGVICASAGNHAQGVAMSARKLGARALIVMPTTTPQLKIDAVKMLGGEVVLSGDSYSDAYGHSLQLEQELGLTFIHPFDDPDVIAGQGTIAMELLRQLQSLGSDRLDAVFVAIGGGGLISGVANCIKALRPEIKIIGVQMNDSDAMIQSVKAQQRVTLADVGLFSDGTAVKCVGRENLRITQGLVDGFISVDTDAVCAAIKDVFLDTRSIVEPAGALAVAAIKQYVATHQTRGETYAAILSGANMNFDRLRFVAERAEVGEEREALLAVTIPEDRGSFRRFCELVGGLPGGPRNVTEFNYRISDAQLAHVFVGLTTQGRGESEEIARNFSQHGFETLDLTHDELAKEHLRHLVGGHSALAQDERLLRFTFPERPGALLKFLSLMQPTWNISLFHYRNQGADYGRTLVGMQVPSEDSATFDAFLVTLGYPWVEETHNPAYRLFLCPKRGPAQGPARGPAIVLDEPMIEWPDGPIGLDGPEHGAHDPLVPAASGKRSA
ncbi:threonine ammonia-lyase, biosynthetic [Verminephrobacter eiseniae]|uniref:threonine ammonia-lyase, biosynthetic n=1 Tax=Verminephrobacter eiseniae TaxID=364317 RepID=UPI002238D922|nr:threonine ammonia-lyase, biosynthetic [Verminephrobacter eiseniae]MCW5233131.1 threonine ammonia-lyase, biosynthetic [Verminephrobacter eiseniae]MCW5295314.1 threonine ammonia-lyase, biosynthetic [Verminephrobacter eiseniae]MCW8183586.1 threonine ammonia-lyase, biosynthetic [Verminephrobacter eiseniae]MCW8223409.1 threonine ammonia-lyase, biosynthetic [Verminephrobacter eiseniae]MCW8233369.1 threonine ammonia-lyase, biosynthetic [Verminephrobacter eiseniae]